MNFINQNIWGFISLIKDNIKISEEPLFFSYQVDKEFLKFLNKQQNRNLFINFINEKRTFALNYKKITENYFFCFTPIHFQTRIDNLCIENNFDEIFEKLNKIGCVFLYIQTKNQNLKIKNKFTSVENFRSNYFIDLDQSEDYLLKKQKKDARYRLKKILKKNFKINEKPNSVLNFYKFYKQNEVKKKFNEKYSYKIEDFNKLKEIKSIKYLEIISKNQNFLAGGFFAKNYNDVDYLYGVDSGFEDDATRLLIFKAFSIFKNEGFKRLYLGGGTYENDNLSKFKERLGGIQAKCCVVRSVINIKFAEKMIGKKFSKDWFLGYFPPGGKYE